MANRYPLILDVTDGNKIKELPEGDNLYLRTNSIEEVQDINALGTINAADIRIAGQRLQPQGILDFTDTPSSYEGAANQILKVKSTEDGIDFVDVGDLGDLTAGNIIITGSIVPDQDNTSSLGNESRKYTNVRSYNLFGNLRGHDGTLVFDAATSRLFYGALVGAPTSLSEFTNDVGYVTINQVSSYLEDNLTISDFRGSVFADDSTLLVDGVNGNIPWSVISGVPDFVTAEEVSLLADIENLTIPWSSISDAPNFVTAEEVSLLADIENLTIPWSSISDAPNFVTAEDDVTFNGITTETLTITGVGTSTIQSGNDIVLQATNRTRIEGTPFRVAQLTTTERNEFIAQNGDIIYNTTDNKFQGYENGSWVNLI